MGYIYKITNTVNGKVYIGKTTASVEDRWRWHKCAYSCKNRSYKSALYDAMKKYGKDKFVIEAIEECATKDLDDRERYWIAEYNSMRQGYNLTTGGDGHNIIDDDEKAEILALWRDGYTQKEIYEIKGRYIKAIKRILYDGGVTREEILARQKSIYRSAYGKRVYVYDMEGNYITEFPSIMETAEELGLNYTSVCNVLKGKYAYSHNYVFRYFKADKIEPTQRKKPRNTRVHQYSLDGYYIASYPSFLSASKAVGLADGKTIKKSCHNKDIVSGGYQWREYKADKVEPIGKRTKRSKCLVEF